MEKKKHLVECPCEKECKFEIAFTETAGKGQTSLEVTCECCDDLLEITLPGQAENSSPVYRQID